MKLPSSSIRAALRSKRKVDGEKFVSLEGVLNHLDKVIDLSSPKHKRTTRGSESKSHGLLSYSGHPFSEDPSSATTTTTALYECPVVTNPNMKHYEENIPSFEV